MCITEACSTKSLLTNTHNRIWRGLSNLQQRPRYNPSSHSEVQRFMLIIITLPWLFNLCLIGFITHISLGPPKFNGCLTCYCFFFFLRIKEKKSKFMPFSARDTNQINMQIININQSVLSPGALMQAPLFTELLLNDIVSKSEPIVSLYELLPWEQRDRQAEIESCYILRVCSLHTSYETSSGL